MDEKMSIFLSRISELTAGGDEKILTVADLKSHFSEMQLDDDQLRSVISYLAASGIRVADDVRAENYPPEELPDLSLRPDESKPPEDDEDILFYLQQLENIPEIPEEESRKLSDLAAAGNERAMESLLAQGMKLVYHLACECYRPGRGFTLYELIQEGNIGLIYASRKFSMSQGMHFYNYASCWIRQSILRAISLSEREYSNTGELTADLDRIEEVVKMYNEEFGKDPTLDEISQELTLTKQRILRLIDLTADTNDRITIDRKTLGRITLAERTDEKSSLIRAAYPRMRTFEKRVLDLYYGFEGGRSHTMGDVCRRLSISPEHFDQIRARALMIVRKEKRS